MELNTAIGVELGMTARPLCCISHRCPINGEEAYVEIGDGHTSAGSRTLMEMTFGKLMTRKGIRAPCPTGIRTVPRRPKTRLELVSRARISAKRLPPGRGPPTSPFMWSLII